MKPDKIFIVRHGQSVGNVDRSVYKTIPDYALQLTELGQKQAIDTGITISEKIGPVGSVQFYVSPFWRTRQTYLGIAKGIKLDRIKYYEDPRLREQEWNQKLGSREGYRDNEEMERDNYGHFYYRFETGESCADVYDRVSDFMNTMFRDFNKKDFPRNVVIVMHGMTMRLFLMRWFHMTVEDFERLRNPWNGEFYLLERGEDEKYALKTPLKRYDKLKHNYQFDYGDDKVYFPLANNLPYEVKT